MEKTKKKLGRPKKEVNFPEPPDISKQLGELTDIVLSLSNEVKELRDQKLVPVAEAEQYEPKTHVPKQYLEVVREVLGPEFGVESNLAEQDYGIQAIDDPRMLHIIVPDKYNVMNVNEKKNESVNLKQEKLPSQPLKDIRSKVIEDDNSLRIWCEQMRNHIMKYLQDAGKPRQYQL